MRSLIFLLATILMQNPQSPNSEQSVVQRGERVMGFSHEKTTHHFLLYPNGGEISIGAHDSADKTSVDQIRMHLGHIAKMFAAGNFNAPMLIHETTAPGVPTMTRLKQFIKYEYSDTEHGARIRLITDNLQAVDAIHAFLLFQIVDHHTGDNAAIIAAPTS